MVRILNNLSLSGLIVLLSVSLALGPASQAWAQEADRFQKVEEAKSEGGNQAVQAEADKAYDNWVQYYMGGAYQVVANPRFAWPFILNVFGVVGLYRLRSARNLERMQFALNAVKQTPQLPQALSPLLKEITDLQVQLKDQMLELTNSEFRNARALAPVAVQSQLDDAVKLGHTFAADDSARKIDSIFDSFKRLHQANVNYYKAYKDYLAGVLQRATKGDVQKILRAVKDPAWVLQSAEVTTTSDLSKLGLAIDDSALEEVEKQMAKAGVRAEAEAFARAHTLRGLFPKGTVGTGVKGWMSRRFLVRSVIWGSRLTKNMMLRSWRVAWPVAIGAMVTMGLLFYSHEARSQHLAANALNTAEARKQSDLKAALSDAPYVSQFLNLMVQIQWLDLQKKYGKEFDIPCPITLETGRERNERVHQAYLATYGKYIERRANPVEINGSGVERELILSKEFIRDFYFKLFTSLRDQNASPLKAIRAEFLFGDNLDGKGGIVDELSLNGDEALRQAFRENVNLRALFAEMTKVKKEDRAKMFEAIPEENARTLLRASLESYEAGLVKPEETPEAEKEMDPEVP